MGIFQWRVGQMRPDSNCAASVGDNLGLLFANRSWAHHLRHTWIVPQLRIETGMGDDDRPVRGFQSGLRGYQTCMGEIDHHAKPVAFLDDGRSECGQSVIPRRIGVDIAQRHSSIAVVK